MTLQPWYLLQMYHSRSLEGTDFITQYKGGRKKNFFAEYGVVFLTGQSCPLLTTNFCFLSAILIIWQKWLCDGRSTDCVMADQLTV